MNKKFSFRKYILLLTVLGLPQWLSGKESTGKAGDLGLISGWGRSPGEGTHSSILTCETLWTEAPGRLESVGSEKSQI